MTKTFACNMERWFVVLGWFLSILTIIGNGFNIFLVCNKRQLRTKTNAFVVSLAVADFCVGICVFPLLFLYETTRDRSYSQDLKRAQLLVRWFLQDASVMCLCSLVLERYIAIVMPYKYGTFMTHRRVIQMIALPWTITVIFISLASSPWIGLNSFNWKIFMWFVFIFFKFLPCCMVIVCLVSMLRVVYKHKRQFHILTRQLRFNHRVSYKSYEKCGVVLMSVVSGFFLAYNVLSIRCGILIILSKSCLDSRFKIPVLVINSAVNPFAYAVFKRDIKKELKRMMLYKLTITKNLRNLTAPKIWTRLNSSTRIQDRVRKKRIKGICWNCEKLGKIYRI